MFNFDPGKIDPILVLLVVWESFWKGLGMWKAAKKGALVWFVAMFLINSIGLIPIFYLWRNKILDSSVREVLKLGSKKS